MQRALPADHYLGSERFDLERERIFRRAWHPVARFDHLPEPGDYRALDLFGEPIVLARGEDGELRALSRICRHRAFPVVDGEGNAKRLTCPYHRWSYDLTGALRASPCMDEVAGFDRSHHPLPELALAHWQGFVLVSLDPEAVFDAGALAPVDALLDEWQFSELRAVPPLEYDSPWNWKVMVENFMESYHHLGAHAETLQSRNPAQGTYPLDLQGPFTVLENPASESTEGAEPFWVIQVFPTLMFFLQRGDLPLGVWFEMQIDAPDHFHLRIHPLLPASHAETEQVANLTRAVLQTVHAEDIVMCEGIQRGLAAGLWAPGPLSRQEGCLVAFHRYLAEQLA